MATLVSFHAHPDDETVLCGGTLYLAAQAGHRVVLVCATDGERGEYPDGLLEPGESLAQRRRRELADAARILGIARVVHLGYHDSGMLGDPSNADPGSFHAADLDQAAGRLAAVLTEESAQLLTVYDHHGTYDHPDHVKVHRVGVRAAQLASTPQVLEATLCRDRIARMRAHVDPEAADQSRRLVLPATPRRSVRHRLRHRVVSPPPHLERQIRRHVPVRQRLIGWPGQAVRTGLTRHLAGANPERTDHPPVSRPDTK